MFFETTYKSIQVKLDNCVANKMCSTLPEYTGGELRCIVEKKKGVYCSIKKHVLKDDLSVHIYIQGLN